jgi:hypothetical protein
VGQTFRLIEIANKPYFGYCCLVVFRGPVERHIPVRVTDLAAQQPVIFPLPLDLASVQQLVATYERILCQRAEGTGDEPQQQATGRDSHASATSGSLVSAERDTKTAGIPGSGLALPPDIADGPTPSCGE